MKEEQQNLKKKDVGIEWICNIPFKWELKRVKNLFYISKQKAHAKNPVVLSLARSGVKVRDISNNEGQLAESYEEYNPVIPGDLLLNPMDLYSGANCSISEVSGVISPAYINLRAIDNNVNSKFYDYYFKVQYWSMAMFAHGKGVSYDNRWTINRETILNYYLPYISFDKQNDIVKLLNDKLLKISKMIEIEERKIEKLKEYKQSLITEVVTKGLDKNVEMKDSGVEWIGKIPKHFIMQRMKRIGHCRNGLTYSPDEMCESNGILVLRSSNIQNGRLVFEDNVYVNKTVKDDLIVKIGDILICSRNGSRNLIGKNAIIESDLKCSFGAFMMIFRSNYNSKYIYYILNSSIFNYYLGTYLTSTINQLTGSNFENMIIPFTNDKKEQNEIVNFLDDKSRIIEETINIKYKKIERLNEYKKSLIYEYVTGKKEV